LIDGSFIAGESVATVIETYGFAAGLSGAALYRHRRGLHHAPKVLADGLPGERPGDLIAALLSAVQTAQNVKDAAEARGSEAVALRAAGEVRAGILALADRLGVTDEAVAAQVSYTERIRAAIRRGALLNPDIADLLADGARAVGDLELADDAHEMGTKVRAHLEAVQDRELPGHGQSAMTVARMRDP